MVSYNGAACFFITKAINHDLNLQAMLKVTNHLVTMYRNATEKAANTNGTISTMHAKEAAEYAKILMQVYGYTQEDINQL